MEGTEESKIGTIEHDIERDESKCQLSNVNCAERTVNCASDAFDYGEWLSSQEYYDDYKHSQHANISFPFYQEHNGAITKHRVTVVQDRKLGRGGIVWCAGYILADHVLSNYGMLLKENRPINVLELGAGTGITGISLAAHAAVNVCITDLAPLLPLLRRNSELNEGTLKGRVHTEMLAWGEAPSPAVSSRGPFDLILAADCVYADCAYDLLPKTIAMHSHANTTFILSCRCRLEEPIAIFENELKRYFRSVRRVVPTSSNKNPGVFIVEATEFLAGKCEL